MKTLFAPEYGMVSQDEGIYILGSKLFSITHQSFANAIIEENVSAIGKYNWYGPFWNILFGSFTMLGGSVFAIISFNILISWVSLWAVFRFYPGKSKLLFGLGIVTSFPFIYYQFSFYPESLILFISLINSFVLYKLNRDRRLLLPFAIWIICLIPVRMTFVLWLFGLLPFLNRRNWHWLSFLIISGFTGSFVFFKFFTAPAFARGMRILGNENNSDIFNWIYELVWNLGSNLLTLFRDTHLHIVVSLFLFLFLIYQLYEKRSRFLFSAALISTACFAVLFLFYTTKAVFFVKQSIIVFPLMMLAMCEQDFKRKKLIVGLFLVTGVFSIFNSYKSIEHHILSGKTQSDSTIYEELSVLKKLKSASNVINVLTHWSDLSDFDNIAQALPVVTHQGKPIRYTTNICYENCSIETKFETHQRIGIDYYLTSSQVPLSQLKNISEVSRTSHLILYRNTEIK